MKGFLLDEKGDIVLSKEKSGKQIQMISGSELIAQKIQTVLGINKGEWFLDSDLGIDFNYVLGKGITEDMRRSQIEDGVHQVNEAFYLSSYEELTAKSRRSKAISITVADSGETIATLTKKYNEETNVNASSQLAEANAKLAESRNAATRLERRLDGETV